VEISRSDIRHNLQLVRERIGTAEVIAVVKANAYGHGVGAVLPTLLEQNVHRFAVATLSEAIELRECVTQGEILVLGGCNPGEEPAFKDLSLTAAVFDSRPLPKDLPVEIKIDTGMTRLGIPWTQAHSFLKNTSLNVTGVYSHFASADVDPGFSLLQLKRFLAATDSCGCRRHICNSAGLGLGPQALLEGVRLGLSIFGISPGPQLGPLRPILNWKSTLISIKEVSAGNVVGYGGDFQTHRKSRMGLIPAGYADGYNRLLSDRGFVRIRGLLAPVAGRVSMDFTCLDLTDVPGAQVGDEVTLIEPDSSSPISAVNLAHQLDTIPYEILTSIGSRVSRVAV
jgi:alanine racemase